MLWRLHVVKPTQLQLLHVLNSPQRLLLFNTLWMTAPQQRWRSLQSSQRRVLILKLGCRHSQMKLLRTPRVLSALQSPVNVNF
jgi:hypothetical protein